MAKRTIAGAYYIGLDGVMHGGGTEVELSADDIKRGETLGAFEPEKAARKSKDAKPEDAEA